LAVESSPAFKTAVSSYGRAISRQRVGSSSAGLPRDWCLPVVVDLEDIDPRDETIAQKTDALFCLPNEALSSCLLGDPWKA
jgi:hypothetical protein